MPATGEHGIITTDTAGHYFVNLGKVYDSVSLSEGGYPYRCGSPIGDIPAEAFSATNKVVYDFVCPIAIN